MRFLLLLSCLVSCVLLAGPPDSQPPQLLGVWYGTYSPSGNEDAGKAEMWMEISWQLSKDGWTVAGHNRWNIPTEDDATPQGEQSLGRQAEHFDSIKGRIASHGKSVSLAEQTRGSRIEAQLTGTDSMQATFYEKDSDAVAFTVELDRIDTRYSPTDVTIRGIDVSHHSGNVDWEQVKSQHFQFAYVKSSEGVDNPDAMFEQHWRGLKQAGLARGAYHFYVTEDDPVEQAKFFASRIKSDPGTLPPAVDIELLGAGTHGDMTATLLKFLQTLEQQLGIRPMIYTNSKFWNEHYEPVFSDYPLWMSEYGVKMPKVPFGWDNWTFWQHDANQPVAGVEKNADINLLHPDMKLEQLAPSDSHD